MPAHRPVHGAAAGHVPRADREICSLSDRRQQGRDHLRVVRQIGVHLDEDVVAPVEPPGESGPVGGAQARGLGAAQHADAAELTCERFGEIGGAVGAGVVDDEDVGCRNGGSVPPGAALRCSPARCRWGRRPAWRMGSVRVRGKHGCSLLGSSTVSDGGRGPPAPLLVRTSATSSPASTMGPNDQRPRHQGMTDRAGERVAGDLVHRDQHHRLRGHDARHAARVIERGGRERPRGVPGQGVGGTDGERRQRGRDRRLGGLAPGPEQNDEHRQADEPHRDSRRRQGDSRRAEQLPDGAARVQRPRGVHRGQHGRRAGQQVPQRNDTRRARADGAGDGGAPLAACRRRRRAPRRRPGR